MANKQHGSNVKICRPHRKRWSLLMQMLHITCVVDPVYDLQVSKIAKILGKSA